MLVAETIDRADPWPARLATARTFEMLSPFFNFLIQDQALGDSTQDPGLYPQRPFPKCRNLAIFVRTTFVDFVWIGTSRFPNFQNLSGPGNGIFEVPELSGSRKQPL